MMEHLPYVDAMQFLKEVRRILKGGGQFRLVLPDLRYYIACYCENNDADEFMRKTYLSSPELKSIRTKLRYLIYGNGIDQHSYMYDADSVSKLLTQSGFRDIVVLKAGETTMNKIDGIDLYARQVDSLYIECRK